jgi:hypothetical protein
MKKRKLICRLIGCNVKSNIEIVGSRIEFIFNQKCFCKRCGVHYGTYNRSVIGIIKKAISDIKYLINE